MNLGKSLGLKRAVRFELRVKLLGPQRLDTAGDERASDQGPVGFYEAEDAVDGEILTK
jgi:hypothetical protein